MQPFLLSYKRVVHFKAALMEEQIIIKTLEQFKLYGIKSVSIDDICRQLGISKKTFYQYFPSKEELVARVLRYINEQSDKAIQKMLHGKQAIDCIKMIVEKHQKMSDVHKRPPFLYDLQKYYPQLFKAHIQNIHSHTMIMLVEHLNQGIKEGVYRQDLDVEMCATMYSIVQQAIINNSDEIHGVNHKRLSKFMMSSFLRSIVSEEGADKLKDLL